MRNPRCLAPIVLFAGALAAPACGDVPVDLDGGFPVGGVIRGTVAYDGPPPCTRDGHVVGNAIVLVFDARSPPPPTGLAPTAVSFAVVPGDLLFPDLPATRGPDKACPAPDAPHVTTNAPFVVSPIAAGSYLIQAFFDTTGNFFPTLKGRNLPEATDVGGGAIDVDEASSIVDDRSAPPVVTDAGVKVYPKEQARENPNYLPRFLPVNVGVPGAVPPTSLHGIPDYTLPSDGYVADGVVVTIGEKLGLARPYFHPEGSAGSSAQRPTAPSPSPANPDGNADFVPVLSFPQDILAYAQPTTTALANPVHGGATLLDAYQAGFPQLTLHAGVPADEQAIAADTTTLGNPFHMQLGASNGGNGGLFAWWAACDGLPGCDPETSDFIPENDQVYRMWPLVVLAKLADPADPQSIVAQGSDLRAPAVVIQGITLFQDSLVATTTFATLLSGGKIGKPPTRPTSPVDHVSALLRPSVLCLDPRAPDHGGVLVTPGTAIDPATQAVLGAYPPGDTIDQASGAPGVVVDSHVLSNPQLAKLVNRKAAGTTNGLIAGCLPTGRYQINVVYPTGQAWTTPNDTGSCAAGEGATRFDGDGNGAGLVGTCATKPRPVLYSQGTRAVVEITPAANPANCQSPTPTDGSIPAVPFACTSLCDSPSLDPTASPPCSAPLPAQGGAR